VFVGDTYCYFAGWVFACVAILAHISKTLLLLLIPQIFNFVYSVPQLFHIIPCPRHRLPKFNARTGLLEPSVTVWPREKPPNQVLTAIFTILAKMRLLQITIDTDTNHVSTTSNLTILNLWLVWFGPMKEDRLAWQILTMQLMCGLLGLFIRHTMALWFFGIDNRGPGMV
jgi:UDP-N-acetylglucosamine--dolichyl-phosphate N-acetylglucosaminephosphotransferase